MRCGTLTDEAASRLPRSPVEWHRISVFSFELELATLCAVRAAHVWRVGCVAGVTARHTESESAVDVARIVGTEQPISVGA